jgi:hypothetical protein
MTRKVTAKAKENYTSDQSIDLAAIPTTVRAAPRDDG